MKVPDSQIFSKGKCRFCGVDVGQDPAIEFMWGHLRCHWRNELKTKSQHWKSADDMTQAPFLTTLSQGIDHLLRVVAPKLAGRKSIVLRFRWHIEEFIELTVYENTDPKNFIRLDEMDPEWDEAISVISDPYMELWEDHLGDDEEGQDAADAKVKELIKSSLDTVCSQLARVNFHFASGVKVTWSSDGV